jgi:hypothetical protein
MGVGDAEELADLHLFGDGQIAIPMGLSRVHVARVLARR